MYIYTFIYMYLCIWVCIVIYIYIYIRICMYIYVYLCVYVYTCCPRGIDTGHDSSAHLYRTGIRQYSHQIRRESKRDRKWGRQGGEREKRRRLYTRYENEA